ncbi:hypothetical protein BDV96DRAFT_652393 [Lophiotrema nucula]|uniref:Uncharacterized protein n=1 Tax=Lophiotrema nucula TaxID=690887 RepID=A0A6A5YRS0_9PLEO|nr:hypothetical protein BDV96DRAFT_652393 [Lophiotrema nucula]
MDYPPSAPLPTPHGEADGPSTSHSTSVVVVSVVVSLVLISALLFAFCSIHKRRRKRKQTTLLPVATGVPLNTFTPSDGVLTADGEVYEQHHLTRRRTSTGTEETIWSFGSIRRTLSRPLRRRQASVDALSPYPAEAPPPYDAIERQAAKGTAPASEPYTQPTVEPTSSDHAAVDVVSTQPTSLPPTTVTQEIRNSSVANQS